MAALHLVVKALEEVLRHALGRPVHQALAQLGHLAADLGMHGVAQFAAGVVRHQDDLGRTLAESGGAALAIESQRVAGGRQHVGQRDLAIEPGRYGTDLDGHADSEVLRTGGLHLVAARDAQLEHLGIVERVPCLSLGHSELAAGLHVHESKLLWICGVVLQPPWRANAPATRPDRLPAARVFPGYVPPASHGRAHAVAPRPAPAVRNRRTAITD